VRLYHEYTSDQSFLLPPSLDDLIAVDDPVRFLRERAVAKNRRAVADSASDS